MCPIINENKFIIIPSLRAYHFFDVYEKVITLSLKAPAPPRTSIKVVSDDLLSAMTSFRNDDPDSVSLLTKKKNAWVSASDPLAGKTGYAAAVSILKQNTTQLQDIVNLIISSKKKPSSDTISSVKKLLVECAAAIVDIEWFDQYNLNDNTINGKAHVSINQKDHTILWLALVPVGIQITKRKEDSSNIVVFDNYLNTQNPSLDFSLPFNKWAGANDNNISSWISGPVDSSQSLFSAGSYGTGSPKNIPMRLSNAYVYNKLHKIHETASFRQTDIGVRSSVNMWKIEPSIPPAAPVLTKVLDNVVVDNLLGYNYTFDDATIIVNSTKNIVEMISPNSANTIDQLVRFEKEAKTYSLNKDNLGLMELKINPLIPNTNTIPDQGVIAFNCDKRSSVPTYSFTAAQETQIKNRINIINGSGLLASREKQCPSGSAKDCYNTYLASRDPNTLYINDLTFYIDNIRVKTGTNWSEESADCLLDMTGATYQDCPKLVANMRLRQLRIELDQLLLAMEKYPRSSTRNPVPLVDITVVTEKDSSLSLVEGSENKDYWINIDPEQGCSISKSACSKILLQTVYECLPTAVGTALLPPSDIFAHVCPKAVDSFAGFDVEFKNEGTKFTYKRTINAISIDMGLYPGASWPAPLDGTDYMSAPNLYRVERIFFLNALGNEPNQPVRSTETYLLPLENNQTGRVKDEAFIGGAIYSGETPDGALTNKVKHIFPLINQDKLMVRFTHIPRKSKHVDPYFDRRVPDQNGNASKSIISSPGGAVDNSLMAWQCIDRRDKTYITPPPYYQWHNEMLFRTYFGSLDGIENIGKDMMQTKEPGEWIPYDYL